MAEHNDLGKWGEEYAMNYLRDHGYIILEHDWRYGKSKSDDFHEVGEMEIAVS